MITPSRRSAYKDPARGEAMHTEKKRELMAFGFLALVLVPILSVIVVAGFGFIVWMYQIIAGPPGPPPPT